MHFGIVCSIQKSHPDIAVTIMVASIVIIIIAVFAVMFFLLFIKRRNTLLRENDFLKYQYQQELLQAEIEIHEQSLAYLSEEIHDNIGQSLSLIKLNLALKGEEPIKEARQLAGQVINDLRQLTHSLHPEKISEQGLYSALEADALRINKTRRIKTHVKTVGEKPYFDQKTTLLIYRIYQEAVNNIIKHARAKNIYIGLLGINQQFILDLKDDGRGFNPEMVKEGLGLKTIRKRASMVGGELSLTSTPGHGSHLKLLINLHQNLPDDTNRHSHS